MEGTRCEKWEKEMKAAQLFEERKAFVFLLEWRDE